MTIASETNRNDYVGTGATDTYSYTFKIFDEADILVTQRDTSDVETTLILNTDYTVTGVGVAAGGTIVLTAGNLTTGYALTIRRNRALTQNTDIRNQGDFYPEAIEDALDDLVMKDQTLSEQLTRTVKLPETVSGVSAELPVPAADKVLKWNAAADALEAVDASTLSVTTFSGGLEKTGSDLHIQDGGVTSAKLATNIAIAGTLGITGATTLTGGVTGDVNASGALIGATATIGGKSPLLLTAPEASAIAGPGRAGTLAVTDQAYRRRLNINGGFQVWQLGTGAAATSNTYGPDMVKFTNYGNCTYAQYAGTVDGSQYGMKYGRDNGSATAGVVGWYYGFETRDSYGMRGRSVTFSIYMKAGANFSASGSQVTMGIGYGTGTDENPVGGWTGGTTIVATAKTITTSIARYEVTGTVPVSATQVRFWCMWTPTGTSGADDNVYFEQAQFEEGSVATPFEWRDYDKELAKCKRYRPSFPAGVATDFLAMGKCISATQAVFQFTWEVEPRIVPTGITISAASDFSLASAGTGAIALTALAINIGTSPKVGRLLGTVAAGLTAGDATELYTGNTNAYIYFTGAEL